MSNAQSLDAPDAARQFLEAFAAVRRAQTEYFATERGTYWKSTALAASRKAERECDALCQSLRPLREARGVPPAHKNHLLILDTMCAKWEGMWEAQRAYWDALPNDLTRANKEHEAKAAERAADKALTAWRKGLAIFDSQLLNPARA